MLFKKTSKEKAAEFWNWFSRNNHKYLFLGEIGDDEKNRMLDELLAHLHRYCEHLFFEIGGHPKDDHVDLIITAEGIAEHFDKVEELVDAAPVIKGWRFLKFRQPHGPGFRANYGGKVFDPDQIIFIPLYNEEIPEAIAIRVCYPDFTEEEKSVFINGTYITLDSLIGEKSVVQDVDYFDVVRTPEDISEDDYPRLSSIGQYIKERKHYKYPGEKFDVVEQTDKDGYLTFVTVNFAYRDFRYKDSFPWFMKITMKVNAYNENGHPEEEEAEVLNSFEDFLDATIKEHGIAHYIGRTTLYKKREILYYVDDPGKIKAALENVQHGADAVRDFQLTLEKDPAWRNVGQILGIKES